MRTESSIAGLSPRERNMQKYGECFLERPKFDMDEAYFRLRLLKNTVAELRTQINTNASRSVSIELADLYEELFNTVKKIENEELILIAEGR